MCVKLSKSDVPNAVLWSPATKEQLTSNYVSILGIKLIKWLILTKMT